MTDFGLALRPLLDAAGWALVHSLWQGAVLAALYACFAALVPRRAAGVRYAGGVAALLLLLLLPVLTAGLVRHTQRDLFARESVPPEGAWPDSTSASARAPRAEVSAALVPNGSPSSPNVPAVEAWRARAEERLTALLPWLVCAWLSGVLLLASRMVGAWLLVLRLKRSAGPVPRRFEELLARVSGRLRVRRAVVLCRSALVEVPMVVGHLRPVILIPAGALLGLTPQQLEAVLAHELAHVRRWDYAVNLLQTAVETLLFYHPEEWWLSGRVRAEREHACDDAAVEATGDAL